MSGGRGPRRWAEGLYVDVRGCEEAVAAREVLEGFLPSSWEVELDRREGESEPEGEEVVYVDEYVPLLWLLVEVLVDVDADEDEEAVETFD